LSKKEFVFESPIDRKGHTIAHNIVLRDPELTEGEKLVYFLLRSYAYRADNCYPGQERLARNLGMSKRSIRRRIEGLIERGLIAVKKRFNEKGQQTSNIYYIRDLSLVYRDAEEITCREADGAEEKKFKENDNGEIIRGRGTEQYPAGVSEVSGAGVPQLTPPGVSPVSPEEVKGFKNKDLEELYRESLDCLNKKAGKNFQITTPGTRELLKGLYNQGFRMQEIRQVINKKSREWLGTEYEKYLRPRTLFSPGNFENYLNEPWPGRAGRKRRGSGGVGVGVGGGGAGGSGKAGGSGGKREAAVAANDYESVEFLEKNGWN